MIKMTVNFTQMQQQIKNALAACQSENGISFRIAPEAVQPTAMATSMAILVHELFDLLPTEQSNAWLKELQTIQDPVSGLFIDPQLSVDDVEEVNNVNMDYITYQTSYFACAAFDALKAKPRHPLTFAIEVAQRQEIERWLDNLNWFEPWGASNWVMFLASALYAEWQWQHNETALSGVHTILDWLDSSQDSQTGFWGVAQDLPLDHAMAAAYHFLPYYFCLERKLHHIEKIIDNTLSLQADDGLFNPAGGGDSCLDVDAIDILVKCSLVTSHRAEDIKLALKRAYNGLVANQAEDGGFCRAKHRPFPPKSRKRVLAEIFGIDKLLDRPYVVTSEVWHYSGWQAMPFDIRKTDLWSTWFRPFGLALIETRYPDNYPYQHSWVFRRLPALGWHNSSLISQQSILYGTI